MNNKPRRSIYIGCAAVLAVGFLGFEARHWFLDFWYSANQPALPPAQVYTSPSNGEIDRTVSAPPAPIEGGIAKSENFVLDSSPQESFPEPKDPLAGSAMIPTEINLDVPWMSQAPLANWDYPYQEACEEASVIMVDRFYKGERGIIDPDDADIEINELVTFQNNLFGDYMDTSAEQTAQILKDYYGYRDVRILRFENASDLKNVIGRGFPVIIPFSGKDLQNPNYRNGGPLYHMLVVKGYTKDGQFITGDPGTRRGKDFLYSFDRIVEAAHDWNGGNVLAGKKVMIVVIP